VTTAVYQHCGLRIRSEIELALPRAPLDAWDVDVRWGEELASTTSRPRGTVIASFETPDYDWYTATETDAGYVLHFLDCCEFAMPKDASAVTVRAARGDQADLIPILIAGTLVAFLLAIRGTTVLHASAIAIEDRVLAFVGQSGQGKTTLAALLCLEAGARLVTDDLLAVDPGPPVCALGGAIELRLRPGAAALARESDLPSRLTSDERHALAPNAAPIEMLPLAAIVVPSPSRSARELTIERVAPSDALIRLLRFPRIYGWRRADVLSRDFANLAQVGSQVPVFDATIPWGPPFGPSVAQTLAALISTGAGGQ
jgi:hypothetical protein